MYIDFEETIKMAAVRIVAPPKVLIVDDDVLVRESLEALIATAGFPVRSVPSAAAALSALRKNFAPIVLTDRVMPDMDGLTLCQVIRNEQFDRYVYVILLTAQDAESDILAGLEAGADDYLSKRVSPAQLVARLRTAQRVLTLEDSLRAMVAEKGRMAATDALTGVNNRRFFMRHMNREIKRSLRSCDPVSLLMLDIDHFKNVNDQLGHAAGDEVLQEFSKRVGASLPRDSDWYARLGGEEFAVVLPMTSLDGARGVAERIREAVCASAMKTGAGTVNVSVSVGVSGLEAVARAEDATVEHLLDLADRCLYESKQAGRNRVTVVAAADVAAKREA